MRLRQAFSTTALSLGILLGACASQTPQSLIWNEGRHDAIHLRQHEGRVFHHGCARKPWGRRVACALTRMQPKIRGFVCKQAHFRMNWKLWTHHYDPLTGKTSHVFNLFHRPHPVPAEDLGLSRDPIGRVIGPEEIREACAHLHVGT